jgi:FkbM family methyltransferase
MTSSYANRIHAALYAYSCEFDAEGVMASFHVQDQTPEPGIIRNFLGMRIEPYVYPQVLTKMSGQIEAMPRPGNWHADIAEWASALRSVVLAQEQGQAIYRIIEAGCGWGCWITNMGVAARARGLAVDLIGIEGDAYHLQSAAKTLALNGFEPGQFSLHHGVAGPRPGKAIFPVHATDGANWGAEPVFYPDPLILAAATHRKDVQILDCMTLTDLAHGQPVDLLHIDIQGAEVDFIRGNFDAITAHVKRVLIGTHSRVIEGQLCDWFARHGWRMEMDRAVIATLADGRPVTQIDGVQLWASPMLGSRGIS